MCNNSTTRGACGGCFAIILVLSLVVAALLVVRNAGNAIDSREVHSRHYQEVLDMSNASTAELIQRCMSDGKITVAELSVIRKRFNETNGPQAELERRYGE